MDRVSEQGSGRERAVVVGINATYRGAQLRQLIEHTDWREMTQERVDRFAFAHALPRRPFTSCS